MLMPRKVAHRKHHRGRTRGLTKGGAELAFGEYGIQALEPGGSPLARSRPLVSR
jgi:large subunit ribosomal protein L16